MRDPKSLAEALCRLNVPTTSIFLCTIKEKDCLICLVFVLEASLHLWCSLAMESSSPETAEKTAIPELDD